MAKRISKYQKARSRANCRNSRGLERRKRASVRNKNNQTNLDFDKPFRLKALYGNLPREATDRSGSVIYSLVATFERRLSSIRSAALHREMRRYDRVFNNALDRCHRLTRKVRTRKRTHKPKKTQSPIPYGKPYEPSTNRRRTLNEARSNRPPKPSLATIGHPIQVFRNNRTPNPSTLVNATGDNRRKPRFPYTTAESSHRIDARPGRLGIADARKRL